MSKIRKKRTNLTSRRTVLKSLVAGSVVAPFARRPLFAQETLSEGVSDNQIVLGTSAAFSGPSRGLGIELYRGSTAYFTHVNQSGGLFGREIKQQLYDDSYQPDPAVTNTTQLMVEDDVFALFGYVGTPTVTRVLPLLKKFQDRKFMLMFPFTGAQPQREFPYGDFAFNLRASYRQETGGLVDNFVGIGRERIGVFYQADAYGRSGWAGVRAALSKYDLSMVGEATYRRGTKFTANLREQVEILKAFQPQAIICIGAYAACAAFLRDAVDGGLQVPIANLSFVGSENLLKLIDDSQENSEDYTKFLVNSQVVPSYTDDTLPGVIEYNEFMSQYNPSVPEEFDDDQYTTFDRSFVSLEGFLNAKLMTEILRRVGGSPKRLNLEEAVFSIKDFDLGIGEPVSFDTNRRQGLDRVYYTVVENGVFVPLRNWKGTFS